MFTFSVTINGVTVRPEKLNQTFKIDESLDSAILVIPFTTRQEAYDRFSRVSITIGDGTTTRTTDWILYSDQIAVSTLKTVRYDHTIGLLEPTKLLEKYACGTLTFTQPLGGSRYTMLDVVSRIRMLTPFVPYEYIYDTRVFDVETDLSNQLALIQAPQLYLDKKNLREALIDVFKYIDAIPRLVWVNDVLTLRADYINRRQLNITPSNQNIITLNLTDLTDDVSGENYASKVESYLENIIPSEDETPNILDSSTTEYVTFRSDDIIIGESNFKLKLTEEVEKLISIKLITSTNGTVITAVDMLPYCVEKAVYDTLETVGGVGTKHYSFYWTKGSRGIEGFNYTNNALFPVMSIENILNYVNAYNKDWEDILFKIEYIPRIELMRSEQYREDYNGFIESEIQINQSERINSLYGISNNLYGQIQRIGVDTLAVSKVHKSLHEYDGTHLEGIWGLGDYTSDDYFVTAVELIYFSYFVVARYELSKNWNRIAQFINIDKEFRPYEISLSKSNFTLRREVNLPFAFIEISNVQRMTATTLSKYSALLTPFMKTIKTNTAISLPITQAVLDVNGIKGVTQPIALMAEKNALKLRFGFHDTVLAGNSVVRDLTRGNYAQKQVKYTNGDGTLQFAKISLYNGLWDYTDSSELMLFGMRTASRELPQVESEKNVIGEFYTYHAGLYANEASLPLPQQIGVYVVALDTNQLYRYTATGYYAEEVIKGYKKDSIFTLPNYLLLKDGAEIMGFNLEIPVLPYKNEVNRFIIGDSLIKENGIIKARGVVKTLYIRSTDTLFTKTDTKKFTDVTDSQTLLSASIVDNYIDMSGYTIAYDNYAITDSSGNIYLAVNRRNFDGTLSTINKIYFNFVDRRTKANIEIVSDFAQDVTFALSFEITATGYMPTELSGEAELTMALDIIATGFSTFFQYEVGNVEISFDIAITATGEKDEFSWFSISNPGTYDYNFTFSLPTVLLEHYNKTARLSDGEIPPSYTYWRAL